MKILLVQAYLGDKESPVFPMGLSCLISSLTEHELKGFDLNVSQEPFAEFARLLAEFVPEVVGISLRNIDSTNKRKVVFYYTYFKKMVDIIKSVSGKHAKIVVGGSGFSMFAETIMEKESRIDYGIFMEGEHAFPELLNNVKTPERVKGIYYRQDERVVFSGFREYPDINALPPPDKSFFDVELYKHIPEAIGIETKRGCALKCIYCVYGFLNGTHYRLRMPEQVADEIEALVKEHKIRQFTFIDSVFNFPVQHAKDVCKTIIERNLEVSWSAWFHDSYMTEDFVDLIKRAGCTKIILSPDGFSDNILQRLGKTQTKKDILRTFNLLKALDGIEICYNFFKNPPGQNLKDFLSLVRFFVTAKLQLQRKVHFEFSSLRVEPYTRLYDIAIEEGIVERNDTLLYPKFYTQRKTRYIETIFNVFLRLKGM